MKGAIYTEKFIPENQREQNGKNIPISADEEEKRGNIETEKYGEFMNWNRFEFAQNGNRDIVEIYFADEEIPEQKQELSKNNPIFC